MSFFKPGAVEDTVADPSEPPPLDALVEPSGVSGGIMNASPSLHRFLECGMCLLLKS